MTANTQTPVSSVELVEKLRSTKTERLMRAAFGGIMLDMEEERQTLVNPDGPAAAALIEQQATELSRIREALTAIHDLTDGEIKVRFRTSSSKSEEEIGRGSAIYSLLVVPRNIARQALERLSQ